MINPRISAVFWKISKWFPMERLPAHVQQGENTMIHLPSKRYSLNCDKVFITYCLQEGEYFLKFGPASHLNNRIPAALLHMSIYRQIDVA